MGADDAPFPVETPEAPFGYTLAGTPRKSRGGRPRKGATRTPTTRGPSTTRTDSNAPGRKPQPSARKKSYAPAVEVITGLVLTVGNQLPTSPVVKMDLGVLYLYQDPVIQAGDQLAQKVVKKFPDVGPILEKIGMFGRGGELMSGVIAPLAQILSNHGVPLSMTSRFGAVGPEEFQQKMLARALADLEHNGQHEQAEQLRAAMAAPPTPPPPETSSAAA